MKSRIIIPETFMGIPIDGAIERLEQTKKPEVTTPATPSIILPDSKKMIYIPEAKIYAAKQRTHNGLNWHDTHKALSDEGLRMPTMNEFRAYLKHLRDNSSNPEYMSIFNEIIEAKGQWRSEWIDAYFEERKTGLLSKGIYLLTHNKTVEEKLEDCLMQDKTPGISLDSWLNDSTSQGFPKKNIPKGELYFYHPRNGAVVWFNADSDGADLNGNWGPSGRGPSLGVYAVSEAGS